MGAAGRCYAAMIAAYVRNLAQLPIYAHRSWWGRIHQSIISLAETRQRSYPLMLKCARALLAMAGANLPNLAAFAGPKGRIGALSNADATRFLRLRALAFRRTALRRCVDRLSRARLYEWVDVKAIDYLMMLSGSPQLDLLEHAFDMPPLHQVQAEDLEWEGLCLLRRDGLWDAHGPFMHLRMRFARARAPLQWVVATAGQDGRVDQRFDPDGSTAVLALLNGARY